VVIQTKFQLYTLILFTKLAFMCLKYFESNDAKKINLCLFRYLLFRVIFSPDLKKQALDCIIIGTKLKRLHIDNITEK